MTRYLLSLGHRRIGFIRGDPNHSVSQRRYDGFRATMMATGAGVDERHVLNGDFSFRSGLELGELMLRGADPPTAIFASNDDMALGVLMSAVKLGVPVPDALSIAGFDDAPTSRAAWPQLTTIRQPKAEMAAAATDILADLGYGAHLSSIEYKRLLPYELIIRDSTTRAR